MSQAYRPQDRTSLELRWIINLRWAAVVAQILAYVICCRLAGLTVTHLPFVVLTLIAIISNIFLEIASLRQRIVTLSLQGAVVTFDVLLLTALLYCYGGHTNPFSMVYLAYIVIGALFLSPPWSWTVFALSAAAFLGLFFDHLPVPQFEMQHHHHGTGAAAFDLHLSGMFFALILIGALITWCGSALRGRIEVLRAQQSVHDQMNAIMSLTAAAAHELATPLGTALLIAESLRSHPRVDHEVSQEVSDLWEQLSRAGEVLSRIRLRSPELQGEARKVVSVQELLAGVLARFSSADQQRIRVQGVTSLEIETLPLSLEEALRSVLKNALEESLPDGAVMLDVAVTGPSVTFRIRDHGKGVETALLPRLGEPFFTLKEPGKGLGLGLFVVRTIMTCLGGTLTFTPREPGLEVCLSVPR